eukprot:COSAG02_NODE_227_length_28153_cov_11.662294_11_plen_53_part_00
MPAQVHLTDTPSFDLVIFGGRLIDPANDVDDQLDVPTYLPTYPPTYLLRFST